MTDSDKFTLLKKDYASLSLCLGLCIGIIAEATEQSVDKVAGDMSAIALMQIEQDPGLVQEVIDRYLKNNDNPPNYYVLARTNKSAR